MKTLQLKDRIRCFTNSSACRRYLRMATGLLLVLALLPGAPVAANDAVRHSIGDPSDEEQLLLELVNRARADAVAEADLLRHTSDSDTLSTYEYFGVDMTLMEAQFAALPSSLPPLAMNKRLLTAARLHNRDMLENAFQSHRSSENAPSPSQPGDGMVERVDRTGYNINRIAENVFSYAKSVQYAHASFEVDWGNTATGMQDPANHRENIHSPDYREVGIAVHRGENTVNGNTVGPMLVTQDFARHTKDLPFITGVAFTDLDGDSFYDVGEGLGGITVTVSGVNTYAVTAQSGGYAVPVPGDGTYDVTFAGPGFADVTRQVQVVNRANVKCDFTPAFQSTVITGPVEAPAGKTSSYTATSTPGATTVEWTTSRLSPTTWIEGAEDGGMHVTADISSGSSAYDYVSNTVVDSGNAAYHLLNPDFRDQTVTLDRFFLPSASSELRFASRLAAATSLGQVARIQISTNDGATWTDVWSQTGTGYPGESSFSTHAVNLGAYANQPVRLRVLFDHLTGQPVYTQTGEDFGFYIDSIRVTDAEDILDPGTTRLGVNEPFTVTPSGAGNILLSCQQMNLERRLPAASPVRVRTTTAPTLVLQPDVPEIVESDGTFRLYLTRPVATGSTTVSLRNESPDLISAPTTVTFGSGELQVFVDIVLVDDNEANGTRQATLLASAPGFDTVQLGLDIADDEPPALQVSPAIPLVREGKGHTTITISRTRDFAADAHVSLSAGRNTQVSLPADVVIPAQAESTEVSVSALDNQEIDGMRTVQVDASTTGTYSSCSTSVTVCDDDAVWKLYPGWNLVSCPVNLVLSNVSSLLQDTGITEVLEWNNGEYQQAVEIQPKVAYWVFVPRDAVPETSSTVNVYLDGELTRDTSAALTSGWNPVGKCKDGLTTGRSMPLSEAWWWDAREQRYRRLQSLEAMELFKGYWIFDSSP